MYRKSFPKCEIKGENIPVQFGHMFSRGAVPDKCSTCTNFFEGECIRNLDNIGDYSRLDYSSCQKLGPTEPVVIETSNDNSIYVPQKCSNCEFMNKSELRGYFCSSESDQWNDFPRDLDWGNWEPDYPLIGLRRYKEEIYSNKDLGNAIVTKDLVMLLKNNEIVKAHVLYRKLNKVETIKEVNRDIKNLLGKLEKL